jgi:hypothetical protein
MENLAAIASTPIPTILVVGGIFFLLLAVASIKGIKPSPQRQKLSAYIGAGLIIVGILLYLFAILSDTTTETATPTIEPTISASITETSTPISQIPSIETVFESADTVHIGDDKNSIAGWEKVSGVCLTLQVPISLPIQEVNLSLETYGATEREIIKVNGSEIAIIPPLGDSNQDKWADSRTFSLVPSAFVNGMNILEICSAPLTKNADYPGEKDDFQVRNIKVVVTK